jgi:hypothetical protein
MKRKIIFSVMLLVLASIIAMQSCKKPAPLEVISRLAAMPEVPVPARNAIIAFTAANQTVNLSWAGTATDAINWTVHFGTSSHPPVVASNVTTNTYAAKIGTKGGVYYWQVETTDKYNINTVGPVWSFDVNSAPGAVTLTAPVNNATAQSLTPAITWTCTDPESDALTYDLYLGTTATPGPYATGLTSATYTPTTALNPSTDYYWKVVAKDPAGASSTSAVFKFTTGALPVAKFVAAYNVAENSVQNGAYAYVCTFTKVDNTTIQADNWWDSGWAAKFILDFTKNTIVMTPFTYVSGSSTYICTGSGKITQASGQIDLIYSVTKNGVLLENGTEKFTLKKGAAEPVQAGKQPKL